MPKVPCSCGLSFDAEPGDAICPGCGAVSTVAEPRVRAACECGAKVVAPARLAGKLVKCPKCGQPVPIPAAAEPALDLALLPATAAPAAPPPVRETRARPAPPPADDGWRKFGRWALAVALLPLVFSLLSKDDDVEQRLDQMIKNDPEIEKQLKAAKPQSLGELIDALPGHRIEGALHSRSTMAHWLYAIVAAGVFWGFILLVYPMGKATPVQLWTVGIFTGTVGILLLLGLQYAAMYSQGVWVTGRGLVVILFYIVKFIGFSYSAALGDTNFFLSMLGFTFGVGLCEELCKALPLLWHYKGKATLDLQGAVVWGLASGIGFGVSEGITYSSDYYNGISTGGIYIVRFVSCVALHAVWSAGAAILIWRRQAELDGIERWFDWFIPVFQVLGISMLLHALYDTALKKEMESVALLTALASVAWFFWLYERARKQEPAFVAGQTA